MQTTTTGTHAIGAEVIGIEGVSLIYRSKNAAVQALGWKDAYFIDADHIGVKTVDRFVAPSDFFTLDVADFINKPAADADIKAFASNYSRYAGSLKIPGVSGALGG